MTHGRARFHARDVNLGKAPNLDKLHIARFLAYVLVPLTSEASCAPAAPDLPQTPLSSQERCLDRA